MTHFVKDIKLIDKFFPICGGVYLHKKFPTTHNYRKVNASYGNFYVVGDGNAWFSVNVDDADNVVSIDLYSTRKKMPLEWEQLGLNWDLSFKNRWLLMKRLGFENICTFGLGRHRRKTDGLYEAEFHSVAPDDSLLISFFFLSPNGNILDNNTLYAITIQ